MTTPTKVLIVVLGAMLSSCGTQHKIAMKAKKIQRLEREINALGGTVSDTVYREVTITVPEIKLDTIVNVVNWHDTITVVKDRITTRVVVTPSTKTVYIESKCDSVIIVKKIPVVVNRNIEVGDTGWRDFWQYAAAGVIGLVFGFVICWVLKTFKIIV